MFSVVRRRFQLAVFNSNVAKIAPLTDLGFNQNSFLVTIRLVSSSLNREKRSLTAENHDEKAKRHSFTVSYLVDICGLCRDSAESAAKVVGLTNKENPDEILGILREYGLSDADVSLLVRKEPRVLLVRKKTLLPKLDFLRSVGVSSSDIGKMVSRNPRWLFRSLENYIIPCYDILKSVLLCDDKVCMAVMRLAGTRSSLEQLPERLVKNVSILKDFGLPQPMISFLLIFQPSLVLHESDKLSRDLRKAIEYGFNPSKWIFVNALQAIRQASPKLWEHKMAIYKQWGLSEDAIWLAFKKYPRFMSYSEKKITITMDLLVARMGWEPAEVARVPSALCYSLDKWIVPRCSIIKTLMSKGFLKGKVALSTALVSPKKVFLEMFVMKYEEELPHLLSIFQGKTNVLTLGSDKKSARKNF